MHDEGWTVVIILSFGLRFTNTVLESNRPAGKSGASRGVASDSGGVSRPQPTRRLNRNLSRPARTKPSPQTAPAAHLPPLTEELAKVEHNQTFKLGFFFFFCFEKHGIPFITQRPKLLSGQYGPIYELVLAIKGPTTVR